ncbi:MAG: ribosome silencing factor [Oscillospiraceae bacterium]|jgi:ribosome-associated protein|nr:ribosome silencing factor [Oscillospiraceae bacterium]
MNDKEFLKIAKSAMDSKKASNIRCLKVDGVSSVADYFLLASGNNAPQVKSIADEVDEKLSSNGREPTRTEGYKGANWIVLDYGSVIIHIFHKDTRNFYDLERLWNDAEEIEL